MSVVKAGVSEHPDLGAKSWIRWSPGKRSFDFALSALLLILLSPLFMAIALALRLTSSGPVFFIQQRNGYAKQTFGIYKFRTMSVMEAGHQAIQCAANDSRVTPIGRFLRKTSLDELPQLINVLKGEMSLVGPRPHPISLDRQFSPIIPGYDRRFSVAPGLTGLAQVLGYRGPTQTIEDMQNRITADLVYADQHSLLMDIRIMAATVPAIASFKNAC